LNISGEDLMNKALLIFIILLTMTFLGGCTQKEVSSVPQTNFESRDTVQTTTSNTVSESNNQEVTVCKSTTQAESNIADLLPSRALFPAPMVADELVITAKDNTVQILFRNGLDSAITLPLTGKVEECSKSECKNPIITATYNGANRGDQVIAGVTKIQSGESFVVTWDCDDLVEVPAKGTKFSADLSFEYVPESTGIIQSSKGAVNAKYD
jgi:hypothetical protein